MESQLDQLDQEIIHYLQRIDSNLNESFKVITQEIIPSIRRYGQHCDNIMDSCQWLVTMFEQTGNVQLFGEGEGGLEGGQNMMKKDSIFPGEGPQQPGEVIANTSNTSNITNNDADDFHTANITTTGQILQLPEFSDDEGDAQEKESGTNTNTNSTMQRQNRKRKVSLLLQQQYGSNSSSIPSPIVQSKKRGGDISRGVEEEEEGEERGPDSSPSRNEGHNSMILQFPTAE